MKQTEKYKLNLIEPTDPFLPEGLNENTQKIEDAMTAHEEGIEQRLTVLEARRFAYGTYKGVGGNSGHTLIPLPFTPKVVLANSGAVGNRTVNSLVAEGYESPSLKLEENGFTVYYELNNGEFNFIAFG